MTSLFPFIEKPAQFKAAVVGIPLDHNSSYLRGSASAPRRIRELLHAGAMNLCTENGLDLESALGWRDLGDLDFSAPAEGLVEIEQAIDSLLESNLAVLSLGGDHSVTYPILRSFGKRFDDLTILHLDAHSDIYEEFEGNRYSHACPFARIMEEGLAKRLVQVGIRTLSTHQREQVKRYGVEVIEMRHWDDRNELDLGSPLYLSLDMDVFDPGFAPGVSHHEPGGMSPRQVLNLLLRMDAYLVGADIVEYNPDRDPLGITGMLAAKLYKELIALLMHS